MKRRLYLVVVVVCVWAVGLMGATHARAADAAPTDVSIAWDTSRGWPWIKVTWRDAPGTANRVQFAGGAPDKVVLVGAAEPNTALLDPYDIYVAADPTRISVEVGDAAGATSPPAQSTEFDTNLEGAPVFDTLVPHGDTFTLTWHIPEVPDPNPGDPLDVFPPGSTWTWLEAGGECGWVNARVQGTSWTPPASEVDGPVEGSTRNPWGYAGDYAPLTLLSSLVRTTVAAATTYTKPVLIAGTSLRVWSIRGTGSCGLAGVADAGRLVHLQARSSSTSPWYGVATTTTAADGSFRFATLAIGTRQFRVVESPVPYPNPIIANTALRAGVSPTATASTTAWVRSARFLDPTIRRGEKSTAHVWVSPGLSTTALLQRWSSTGWVNVKQMPMTNGVAQYRFTPAATSTWRWVIPTTRAPNGLTIAWTATKAFSITVG